MFDQIKGNKNRISDKVNKFRYRFLHTLVKKICLFTTKEEHFHNI